MTNSPRAESIATPNHPNSPLVCLFVADSGAFSSNLRLHVIVGRLQQPRFKSLLRPDVCDDQLEPRVPDRLDVLD